MNAYTCGHMDANNKVGIRGLSDDMITEVGMRLLILLFFSRPLASLVRVHRVLRVVH